MGSPSDLAGETLKDRYRVGEPLGSGGMGVVYRARDVVLDTDVVVKVPHAKFLEDDEFQARFEREVKSLTRLEHPHVVRVIDAGSVTRTTRAGEAKVPYAVLQYLAGGSLKDRVTDAGGRLDPTSVAAWLPAIAETLDHIHGEGVVHRDVKPGNILFDRKGHVFLADFGIAKALGALDTGLTHTGMTPGSPDFMAPEAGTGASVGPAYDQYALAVVVFQVLSGELPHTATNPMVLIVKKASEDPAPLGPLAPNVPKAAVAAVMRALARDPTQRFPSCAAFAQAFVDGLAVPTPSRGPHVAGSGPDAPSRREGAVLVAASRPSPDARGGSSPIPPRRSRTGLVVAVSLVTLFGGVAVLFGPSLFRSKTPGGGGETVRRDPPGDAPGGRAPATPTPATPTPTPTPTPAPTPEPAPSMDEPAAMEAPSAMESPPAMAEIVPPTPPAMAEAPPMDAPPSPAPVEPAWKRAVLAADAKAGEGDWAAAAKLLAEARRAGATEADIPKSLSGGVARYLAPPVLAVAEPAEGVRLSTTTVRVTGTLVSNRSTDRVELNGEALTVTAGRFDATWTAGGAGAQTLTLRVVDGEEDRAKLVRRFTIERIEAVYDAYLKGFAVPVGSELDAATGYPKKIRRLKDDGEMVLIPAGTFQMGAVPGDSKADSDESPRHAVTLSKAYYLDVNEVTNAQFQTFVAATSHRTTAEEQGEGYAVKADGSGWELTKGVTWRAPLAGGGKPSNWERHPVVLVSHDDATAFARWAGAALPTEAQFERAQRGGDEGRTYPWGDALPAPSGFGNFGGAELKRAFPKWPYSIMDGYEDASAQTAPVRSFRPNGFGAYDLSGNVLEWCSDWYDKTYYAASPSRDPSGPGSGSARAARGGAWGYLDDYLRASFRYDGDPAKRDDYLGFRLARSL